MAQPTISLRIRALEHELGGPLPLRGGSRLALTELGLTFLPFARQALAALSCGIEAAHIVTAPAA